MLTLLGRLGRLVFGAALLLTLLAILLGRYATLTPCARMIAGSNLDRDFPMLQEVAGGSGEAAAVGG
jgi:hypothetical protein